MISASNNILTKTGYIPLLSATKGMKLYKGKLHDILFAYHSDLVAIGYICDVNIKDNIVTKENVIQISPFFRVQTPKAFVAVVDIKFGDKIIVFDYELKREEVKTVSMKRKIKRQKLYCALPISTDKYYIINGIVIENAGLS